MDFPAYSMPPPPVITPANVDSLGLAIGPTISSLGNFASAAWPTNNIALFYPFRLTQWATAYQLLFWVGATQGGNIDVGIYDSQKNRIVSAGTTGMSATVNTVQEINITDTVLPPGDYLLGAACSSTSGTVFKTAAADELLLSVFPVYEQATAMPLPDPCVPVPATNTSPSVVAVGIQLRSVF